MSNNSQWNSLLEKVLVNRKKVFPNLELIAVNGFKVERITYGMENSQKGKPVIVFENWRGTNFEYWLPVIQEISKKNTVFAYNRPRIGSSEDDNQLPSIDHIVELLRQSLLEKGCMLAQVCNLCPSITMVFYRHGLQIRTSSARL